MDDFPLNKNESVTSFLQNRMTQVSNVSLEITSLSDILILPATSKSLNS